MEGLPKKSREVSDREVLENTLNEAGNGDLELDNRFADTISEQEVENVFRQAGIKRVRRTPPPQPTIENGVNKNSTARESAYNPGDIIEGVTFSQDERGRLISSYATGRKALLLDSGVNNLSTVSVRVIRDTKPGKPDGFLIVTPVENLNDDSGFIDKDLNSDSDFDDEDLPPPPVTETIRREMIATTPQHNRVVERQAQSLRTIKPALALAREAMADNPSSQEILSRHDEMQTGLLPGERHRRFTALASAIFQDAEAKTMFDAGIDTVVSQKSNRAKETLSIWEGVEPPLLPLLVIGTGPHGANFLATHAMYDTAGHTALAADDKESIGGQFAKAQKAVFGLNSRNRPLMTGENRDAAYRPGTEQTINPMGAMSTVQVSDLSGQAFVSQDAPAFAARYNGFTSGCDFLMGCRLINAEEVDRADGSLVSRCVFEDSEAERIYTIDTDILVLPNGIGEEDFKLAQATVRTQTDLQSAEKKLQSGERPAVMSFAQLVSWCGDPRNSSPMKGVKTAAISGSGDSAIVAAGILLGYEPGSNRMPTSLDRVESVIWLNQNIPSKEEWLEKVRARYIQVGLEFPREEIEGYYSRIIPVADTKVQDLRVSNDSNTVELYCQSDEGDQNAYKADLYISCNGFTNQIPNILTGQRRKLPDQRNSLNVDFFKPGATVVDRYSGETIRITSVQNGTAEYIQYRKDGSITSRGSVSYFNPTVIEDIVNLYFTNPVYSYPEQSNTAVILQDQNQLPLGKRVGDTTFLLGPAAQIPVTQPEIERAPVLGAIPENSAALFRYGRGTEVCAQLVAQRLNASAPDRYDTLLSPQTKYAVSPSLSGTRISFTTAIPEAVPPLPQHIDGHSALKMALQSHLDKLSLPIELTELKLAVEVDPLEEDYQVLSFAVPGLSDINNGASKLPLSEWLYGLANDSSVGDALKNLIAKQRRSILVHDAARASEIEQEIKSVNKKLAGAKVPLPTAERTKKLTLTVTIPTFKSRPLLNKTEITLETI